MRKLATRSAAAARERCERHHGSSWTAARHAPHRRVPLEGTRHTDQEQIQMIAKAIGTPKPSAPKIARTDSES